MKEIKEERKRYGGDKNAINRHSVRAYKFDGHDNLIYLNKTLDGSPPFYEIYEYSANNHGNFLSTTIPVNGFRFFGSGLSWKQAEKQMEKTIEHWFEEMNK